jgi:hypothetical protein
VKKKAVEPRMLVMDEREEKNRSTTGTSRRFEIGNSKMATRNQSVKNKQIAKKDL